LVLGNSKGHLSLYSYAEGKVDRNLKGEGHNGRITGLVHDNQGNLYTCGEDCQLICWSLQKEKQISSWSIGNDKPYSLAYLESSKKLIIGCRQIKVFSIEKEEIIQTFVGHSSEVNILESFEMNAHEYAISAARMEHVMSVWKIGKKGINKPSVCTLIMEEIATYISCHLDDEQNLKVACVTRGGVLHLYLVEGER